MMDCCTRKMKRFIPLSVVTSFISFLSFALRQSFKHYTSHRKQKPKEVKKRPEGQLRVRKLHLQEIRPWTVICGIHLTLWACADAVRYLLRSSSVRPTYDWHLTRFLSDSWALDFWNQHESRQNMNLLQSRICKWETFYFWPSNFLRLMIHLLLISRSFYSSKDIPLLLMLKPTNLTTCTKFLKIRRRWRLHKKRKQ